MKTAVQHIIQYIEQNDLNQDTLHFANLMLEKEKQDLIDSCQTGINKALDYSFEAQDYYNQTFKR